MSVTQARHSSLVQDLAHALSRAERRVVRQIARELAVEHCSIEQWRALVLLSDGRVHTMAEVADFALVPAPSLTRLVDRLVMDGVVHRTADPADRRRVLVQITARGRTLHRTLAARVENACAEVIDVGDVAEAEDLLRLLSAIFDARKAQHHRW